MSATTIMSSTTTTSTEQAPPAFDQWKKTYSEYQNCDQWQQWHQQRRTSYNDLMSYDDEEDTQVDPLMERHMELFMINSNHQRSSSFGSYTSR